MSITINQITNGIGIRLNGQIHIVTAYSHVKPGKGSAFVRVKLKNIKTGLVNEKTFKSAERLDDIKLDEKEFEYLYHSGDTYHFMDHTTYEESVVPADILGEDVMKLLKDNLTVTALCYHNEVLKINLPTFVEYTITHTEPGFRGDTSRAGTKPATIETGANIQVPLFVDNGDTVRVDTRTGEYVERVQK